MKTANTIRIANPSKELVDFMKEAHMKKKERMDNMRKHFIETQMS